MKPGAYICKVPYPTPDHDQRLLITDSKSITGRSIGYVSRNEIVFVLSDYECCNRGFRICWWFVQIMTLDLKVGWVVFCFGEERNSYFERYESEHQDGQSKDYP